MTYKVVARNGNVNVTQWRVGVGEGYHWDVNVGCLCYRLNNKRDVMCVCVFECECVCSPGDHFLGLKQ